MASFNLMLTQFKIVLTLRHFRALYLCLNLTLKYLLNMKHLTAISSLLFFIFLTSSQISSAQIVQVRIGLPPPPVVVVERPPCPGRDYVWIEGHYVYDDYTRHDIWVPGQWEYAQQRYNDNRDGYKHGKGHKKHGNRDYDDRD